MTETEKGFPYKIRDTEAGNQIDQCQTLEEAKQWIEDVEANDKIEGIFTPDFYEIYIDPLDAEMIEAENEADSYDCFDR